MSQQTNRPSVPKAIIHRRILDAAAAEPDASMEALAEDIPSATTELVERVLERYGDPAEEPELDEPIDGLGSTQESPSISLDELTEAQERTLRAIYDDPTATQSELADRLGVAASTICNRVGDIPGFEWAEREVYVDDLFPEENQPDSPTATDTNGGQPEPAMARLEARLDTHETDLNQLSDDWEDRVLADSELLHKVIHACFESDRFTEEDELEFLRRVLDLK